MAAGRTDDIPHEPIRGEGRCTDCDAVFEMKLYPYDTKGSAFVRDHPRNHCHIAARGTRPIAVKDATALH